MFDPLPVSLERQVRRKITSAKLLSFTEKKGGLLSIYYHFRKENGEKFVCCWFRSGINAGLEIFKKLKPIQQKCKK
jgi:hypothetical protein